MMAKGDKTKTLEQVGIDAICARVAECETLRVIAADYGCSVGTLLNYLALPENVDQYARAREAQADVVADDILRIADDGINDTYLDDDGNKRTDHDVIARSRLRVDARKWLAGKMAPKKYGDKLAIGGADDLPPIKTMADEELEKKIAQLMGKNEQSNAS